MKRGYIPFRFTCWAYALMYFGTWVLFAADLPTFDDFRRIDRTRRLLGHVQTAELLNVSRIDGELIMRAVQANTNELKVVWGAAEMSNVWSQKQALFAAAMRVGGDTLPVLIRYACAAARQGEYDLALKLCQEAREKDTDNAVPWLVHLWICAARKQPQRFSEEPPIWATSFRDYSAEAIQARVRLLEKAGYPAYSARRLGFKPDSDALQMVKDLAKPPLEPATKGLLKGIADYLQQRRQYMLTELVGQSTERMLLALRPDVDTSIEVRTRLAEIDKRREDLKALLTDVERNVVDLATEKQMVQYFDDILALGEEEAMKKLTSIVRPTPPPKSP